MNGQTELLADIRIFATPALFNIYFAGAAIPIGFVFAIFLALGKNSPNTLLNRLSRGYIYFFRGSPFFIQLFAFYSLMLAFNVSVWKPLGIDWLVLHPLFLGPAILGLNTTAYTTEIIAGALRATPAGEVEAAHSYGLSGFKLYSRILLPSALRRALPQYSNEAVGMMHATAIASTVTLVDVTRVARDVYANYLLPAEAFGTAALIYFVLTFALAGGFKLLEWRFLRHLRPQSTAAAR